MAAETRADTKNAAMAEMAAPVAVIPRRAFIPMAMRTIVQAQITSVSHDDALLTVSARDDPGYASRRITLSRSRKRARGILA